jgi:hypothetical protein
MVSVLVIGPMVRCPNPAETMDFLRAIKIRITTYFREKVELKAPCCQVLRHVKKLYEYERNISSTKSIISFAQILPLCY